MADDTGPGEMGPDGTGPDETGPDETRTDPKASGSSAPAPRRPGTAAASAASRARRIGGARPSAARPVPADSPSTDTAPQKTAPQKSAPQKSARGDSAKALAGDRTEVGGPVVVTQAPAWLTWVPAAVLTVCAVAMLVLVAVAAHGVWYAKPSSSAVRDQVLAAAKTCTATANTYTYRTIPRDEARGIACSTGKWTGQYKKAMTSVVKPLATKLKASQSIQINNAGIENVVSARRWDVIVYGQTKITEVGQKDQNGPFSARVTMLKVGGKWLIAQIETIAKPSS